MPLWGCIADDVTGATDLATNFVGQGFRTAVFFGVPRVAEIEDIEGLDVAVVALKSRTAPIADAVRESLEALDVLRTVGVARYYVKYCSTFDSTPRGNIGPIIDAVLDALQERITIVVPSFPDADRTVYRGRLFVGGDPLDESPMRHHPLTPMRDASVVRLLTPQTTGDVELVALPTVRQGPEALRVELERLGVLHPHRLAVVIDALDRDDLVTIMTAAQGLRVVTGGSGLALGVSGGSFGAREIPATPGRRAVLCGSASARTRQQIEEAKSTLPWRKLDVARLASEPCSETERIVAWAASVWAENPDAVPLVFSVASLADLTDSERDSHLVERALADVAAGMVRRGLRQAIVAGGESSGSIVEELGIGALQIGPAIAPGVAWSAGTTADGVPMTLALKSGNFGPIDMFRTAWDALPEVIR